MGWLKRWRHRRVLARHRIDPALWHRVASKLHFLRGLDADQTRRLQELALLFLAEKQFTGVRGQALD
ncbi:MAG: zinc-dependent peptidase, partial [Burkholderiales bacterium]